MKVIIAGSRSCTDYSLLEEAIRESGFEITQVICGGAEGADDLGRVWAKINHIPIKPYLVKKQDWKEYGNYAGNLRNIEMAKDADALIALWDGKSTGTKHMISTMNQYQKLGYVHPIFSLQEQKEIKEKNHPKTGFFN